jgi:UDP-N-acetylmuramoyl-tripeptide--D-alanyl-D-alanine ligase
VTFGVDVPADFQATRIEQHGLEETTFRVRHRDADVTFRMSLVGPHSVANAVAAISVGFTHGLEWESIQSAIEAFPAARMRGAAIRFREGFTVIDDSYNSNPAALVGMIRLLSAASGFRRRILVAGDMLELGAEGPRLHAECGAEAARGGIDLMIGVGPSAHHILEGARATGFSAAALHHRANSDDAGELLSSMVEPGDLVLVKGSRGMHLERVVETLRNSFASAEA